MNKISLFVQKHFQVGEIAFPYELSANSRSKKISISVRATGAVRVSTPKRVPARYAEEFLRVKARWVISKISAFQKMRESADGNASRKQDRGFEATKDIALQIARSRLEYFNSFYGFVLHSIAVRNQRTRWGSCSKSGNLSFNYRIACLDQSLADYIIVHELCHRGEMNHSKRFWNLVAKTIPDHRTRRAKIRKAGILFAS